MSVLVMDNARIHHCAGILELVEQFGELLIDYIHERHCDGNLEGVRLIYLPPYSPDLNPIEEAFSKIKAWIRRNNDVFSTGDGILYDMREALDIITAEDAEGYIRHAGYF